ncbi:MAG: ribonuclease D [Pedosphaera sp.]|nr:ribonuclease D [Pedosphaera sp.]
MRKMRLRERKGWTRRACLGLLPRVIDSPSSLAAFMPRLQQAAWLTLDTEADSLHAYPEKLCLLQVGLPDGVELLDPLSGISLDAVWTEFSKHEILMHGADYDLRLLKGGPGFVPTKIFDTMLAARLVGHQKFGLADLVLQHLGVTLEKGSQKANWAQRPLTAKMREYACNDVLYLKPLVDALRALLASKGRLEWHRQECAQLIHDNTQLTPLDPDRVWRMKGSNRLPPAALAVLRELWHWREGEAIRRCRPPFFILSHDLLLEIAFVTSQGGHCGDLVPRRISDQRRQLIMDAVARGLALPPTEHPHLLPSAPRLRLSGGQARDLTELQRKRDVIAGNLDIDPTLLASRAMMLEMVTGDACTHLLPWQRELLTV